MNPEAVKLNYTKYCKLAALTANKKVLDQLGGDEEKFDQFMKTNQLVIDDEHGALGPHGTEAASKSLSRRDEARFG